MVEIVRSGEDNWDAKMVEVKALDPKGMDFGLSARLSSICALSWEKGSGRRHRGFAWAPSGTDAALW